MGDLDQDISRLEVADAQDESMFSIGTTSIFSEQEENTEDSINKTNNNTSVDETADSINHLKDDQENKSETMQNANVSAGTNKIASILDNDIPLESLPLHQVLLFDKSHELHLLNRS